MCCFLFGQPWSSRRQKIGHRRPPEWEGTQNRSKTHWPLLHPLSTWSSEKKYPCLSSKSERHRRQHIPGTAAGKSSVSYRPKVERQDLSTGQTRTPRKQVGNNSPESSWSSLCFDYREAFLANPAFHYPAYLRPGCFLEA